MDGSLRRLFFFTMSLFPADYERRVYAGWLGKCIGVRFGAPLENWSYREIREQLGEVEEYIPLPPGKLFKPDDDTALPMVLLRGLQDYGANLSAAQLGETWLNYLGDQHGTLWWGGYGVSSEHTAYINLASGIPAPRSGSCELNGATLAEQIGGQIFSDIWGLVAPNDPQRAAEYAARAASVSHDGNGVYGGRFVAALVSRAFGEGEPRALIETGLGVIPAESEYARVVRAVRDFALERPDDWRAAYELLAAHFGYDRYAGAAHIIPNAGVVVMALLYGQGDFSRSLQIANMAGWDTDCNVGNVGAILGVAAGLEGIPWRWREPLNDVFIGASLIGARNLSDISACADLVAGLGRALAGQPAEPKPRYHFDTAGATQGWQPATPETVIALRQVSLENTPGALRATVRKLSRKNEARAFVRTFIHASELSGNYYGAGFSPKLYPGQRLSARLYLPPEAPEQLSASLYVWDEGQGAALQGPGRMLRPGEWHELAFAIPELEGGCLSQAGVVVRNLGEPWSGSFLLDSVDWGGPARFSYDWAHARPESGAVSQWTFLRGYWRLEQGAYHGSGSGLSETYSGDIEWREVELKVRLTPLLGDYHNILVRVQGAQRSYALGLAPNQQVALYKNDKGYRRVATAAFHWQLGASTELVLAVEGNRLLGRVTGGPELHWSDEERPYLNGQIGLSNFAGCHTRYEAVRVN